MSTLSSISVIFFFDVLTGFYICCSSAVVVYFVARQLLALQHAFNATGFLNALLSATTNHNYKFTLIVRKDGEILYLNQEFQKMFPGLDDNNSLHISTFMQTQNISDITQEALTTNLAQGNTTSMDIDMLIGVEKAPQTIKLSLEPITGFEQHMLIHGVYS